MPENGRGAPIVAPESAGRQRPGGALVVEAHARPYTLELPDGSKRESSRAHRDGGQSPQGDPAPLRRRDLRLSGPPRSALRVRLLSAQRHDRLRFARPRRGARRPALRRTSPNTPSAATPRPAGRPTRTASFAPPSPIFCRAPRSSASSRTRRSRASSSRWRTLAELAASERRRRRRRAQDLPRLYETWIAEQEAGIAAIAGAPRQATAKRLIASARRRATALPPASSSCAPIRIRGSPSAP